MHTKPAKQKVVALAAIIASNNSADSSLRFSKAPETEQRDGAQRLRLGVQLRLSRVAVAEAVQPLERFLEILCPAGGW